MFDQLATTIAHDVAKAIELVGIAIIAVGAVVNLAMFARSAFDREERGEAMATLRSNFGRSILLGLEFLIAADIINTVAVTPTLQSVIVLGAIVLIRTSSASASSSRSTAAGRGSGAPTRSARPDHGDRPGPDHHARENHRDQEAPPGASP